MANKDDGGPAFPLQIENRDQYEGSQYGMTLRDWFAGQALAGMFANPEISLSAARLNVSTDEFRLDTARAAYASADAMLAARSKGEG